MNALNKLNGWKRLWLLLAAIWAAPALGTHALPASNDSVQSHCRSGEHIYLNAKLDYELIDGNYRLRTSKGDILSICADQSSEPIRGFTVRYGKLGAAHLEYRASPKRRIKLHIEDTGPSMADQIISFSVGRRTYCIVEGIVLQIGVKFYAIEGEDTISYGEAGEYQHGPVEIDFRRISSPIFLKQRPACNL